MLLAHYSAQGEGKSHRATEERNKVPFGAPLPLLLSGAVLPLYSFGQVGGGGPGNVGATTEKPHLLLRRGFSAGDPSNPSKKNGGPRKTLRSLVKVGGSS